jgi:hypothetical protein
MEDRASLQRRIAELEAEVALLRGSARRRGYRYRSDFTFAGLPFLAVAAGPDLERKEMMGHAKGVIALGDIATGVVAIGGVARGVVALGGAAIGLITLGGLSVGALVAVGGLAIGSFAIGGGAVGGAAIGGGAIGQYACGGAAFGAHTVDARRTDPEAVAFFAEYGLDAMCLGGNRSRDHRRGR